MQKLKAGENTTMDIRTVSGVLHVLVHLFDNHVSLIFTGHPVLNRAMPTAEGRAYLRFLKAAAAAGHQLWLIEQRAGEWTSAAAVAKQAEQDLIDGIAANLDATAQRLNERVDVSDILADTVKTGGWNGLRQQYRQVRPTRTNTHAKPLTSAMRDLIGNHCGGVVRTRPGQSWTVLRAIVERGFGDAEYRPGTRIITAVRLNKRGMTVAQAEERAA